ncbi:N-acetyltransferase [Palleronia sediminis]|uniref:N-acetyltransferase n=1 Tax=Palleronia sediminis TaxID=2547833 RepID=A0A4R5ZVZ7_9RHOB|nr:GNAT family N-acetyltransferase [Palleronia sediminis]TDL75251.1 N-acetyltransferase [Palleronia sediminis]
MTTDIAITRDVTETKGRYTATVDGHEAEMTYSRAGPQTIIIDHTAVPDALRGRGVGQALVQRGVEDARAEGRRIVPLCPFAKAQIDRHPEWQDVLAE